MAGFQTMSGIPKVIATRQFLSNTNLQLQAGGIGGFTQPSALFGNSEQGAWWDFSDLANMWQDISGTLPAALESPVGLVLDKRLNQGIRGPELAPAQTNPALWVNTLSTLTTNGVSLTVTNNGAAEGYATIPPALITAGKYYEISITRTGGTGTGSVVVGTNRVGMGAVGVPVHYVFFCNNTGIQFGTNTGSAGDTISFTVSVKSLGACNNLVQGTAGARPTLSKRYNLLTSTEDLTYAGYWAASNGGVASLPVITKNYPGAAAPDGTFTAQRIQAILNGGTLAADFAIVAGGITTGGTTGKVWARATTGSCTVNIGGTNNTTNTVVLTTTWTLLTVPDPVVGSTQYRVFLLRGGQAPQHSNSADVLIWHPDSRLTDDAAKPIPEYQRVGIAATDYDTLGFPAYLLFDGATKWMQSAAAIPWAGNYITGIAGTTTFSTTLSWIYTAGNRAAVDGTFDLVRKASYTGGVRNTIAYEDIGSQNLSAPETSVIAQTVDLSQATQLLRQQLFQDTVALIDTTGAGPTTAGPGLTSQILTVGSAPSGTSNWFNGRMYGIILRNALTNANDFSMTNKWMGSKCGKFF